MAHVRPRTTKAGQPRYAVVWRDPAGKSREKWYTSKRTAERKAAEVTADMAREQYVDDRTGRTALSKVAAEWLDTLTKPKPRTRREYKRLLDNEVLPHFGPQRAIASLKRSDVTGYIAALRDRGLRPQTITNAYAPLRALLSYAAAEGYIPKSPAVKVELPDAKSLGQEDFEGIFLTWPQVEHLAALTAAKAAVLGLITRLTACTGLREAEVAGLNVGDVHILGDTASLSVRRTRTLTADGWVTTTTKGRKRREVPILNPAVTADLAEFLHTHPSRLNPGAILFYGRTANGRAWDPAAPLNLGEFLKRDLKPAAARLGIARMPAKDQYGNPKLNPTTREPLQTSALRFHDLRHTAASLWASSGIEILKVSRWLGHGSTAVTEAVYTHLFKAELTNETQRYAAFLAAQTAAANAGKVTPLRRTKEA
jgi:integrase